MIEPAEDTPDPSAYGAPISAAEVRRRATVGAAILTVRGLAVRALGAAAAVVLARLLRPSDFGVVALGATLTSFIGFASDVGIATALIRGEHRPTKRILEQLLGFQLVIAAITLALMVALAPVFGRAGWIAALMTSSFAIAVFGTPGSIYFERNMMFQRIAAIEVAQNLAYAIWAISSVLLGAGVWGLASATVAQVAVGTVLVLILAPASVVRPRLGLREIRPLIGFGAQFQAINVVNLIRDQGLNIGIAAVGGLDVLGVWAMAYRFIQVPFLLFESLWRITFPAMARLKEVGEDPRPTVSRILSRASVGTGALVCVLVGATPALVPLAFNPRWHGIVAVLPWGFAGILVGGPISVAVAGYLFAEGEVGAVLKSAVIHTFALLLVSLPLLPVFGVTAVGMGIFLSALVEGCVLGLRANRVFGVRILEPILLPTMISAASGSVGWLLAESIRSEVVGSVVGPSVAALLFATALRVAAPQALSQMLHTVSRSVRATLVVS